MNPNFNGVMVKLSPIGFANLLDEINDSTWVYVNFPGEEGEGRCVYWQGVHFKEVVDGN